jgi:hypothetical protein
MRDPVLEGMAGEDVVADGLRRDRLFIAKSLTPAGPSSTAPTSGTASSASGGKATPKS